MKKRGQSWSLDLLIGVVIFSVVLLVIVASLVLQDKGSSGELQEKARVASLSFFDSGSDVGFVSSGSVNSNKLKILAESMYNDGFDQDHYVYTKNIMGLRNLDYCLFFEDQDGNVVLIETDNGNFVGIGSPDLLIAGHPCSEVYTSE